MIRNIYNIILLKLTLKLIIFIAKYILIKRESHVKDINYYKNITYLQFAFFNYILIIK